MLNRLEFCAGVVLGDVYHQAGQHDTDDSRADHRPEHIRGHNQIGHDGKADKRQSRSPPETGVERRHDLFAWLGLDHGTADDGGEDGNSAEQERINDGLRGRLSDQQRTQQHGGNQCDDIGFEQVSGHASAVTDIVTPHCLQ